MNEEILDLRLQGLCCSQIIMQLGLVRLGKENPDLIAAAKGLCNGVHQEKICGILSAGVCLLYLADPDRAASLSAAFREWFSESFGAVDCWDLMGGELQKKMEHCPRIMESSFTKLADLMEWEF